MLSSVGISPTQYIHSICFVFVCILGSSYDVDFCVDNCKHTMSCMQYFCNNKVSSRFYQNHVDFGVFFQAL